MKLEEYRSENIVKKLAGEVHRQASALDSVKIMHVCGTHENTIGKYALRSLLPKNVGLIAGPGCPVCVCPARDIDEARETAKKKNVIIATFGDMLKVPSSDGSLSQAKADGADIRIIYGPGDAVALAKKNPKREVVLFSVGFETTAAVSAFEIFSSPPENFSVLVSHRLIPPVMEFLMGVGDIKIDGFLSPGHVAVIIGVEPFRLFAEAYEMPTVVAGFEPVDVLIAVLMILRQIRNRKAECENEYTRCVTENGNVKAKRVMGEVFKITNTHWRGVGRVPDSGYALSKKYAGYDARKKFDVSLEKEPIDILPGCSCHLVMIGKIYPDGCALFGKKCTPKEPYGPCMVSSEGTCRAWYKYGRLK